MIGDAANVTANTQTFRDVLNVIDEKGFPSPFRRLEILTLWEMLLLRFSGL